MVQIRHLPELAKQKVLRNERRDSDGHGLPGIICLLRLYVSRHRLLAIAILLVSILFSSIFRLPSDERPSVFYEAVPGLYLLPFLLVQVVAPGASPCSATFRHLIAVVSKRWKKYSILSFRAAGACYDNRLGVPFLFPICSYPI